MLIFAVGIAESRLLAVRSILKHAHTSTSMPAARACLTIDQLPHTDCPSIDNYLQHQAHYPPQLPYSQCRSHSCRSAVCLPCYGPSDRTRKDIPRTSSGRVPGFVQEQGDDPPRLPDSIHGRRCEPAY